MSKPQIHVWDRGAAAFVCSRCGEVLADIAVLSPAEGWAAVYASLCPGPSFALAIHPSTGIGPPLPVATDDAPLWATETLDEEVRDGDALFVIDPLR